MKTRTKGKELLKVAMVCILSISMFSAAFVGFNQLIFAAATNEPTPMPPTIATATFIQSPEQLPQGAEAETFVLPSLTLVNRGQQIYPIPTAAMPMEEAAQIGARYIWDIFGTSIDGLYMEMTFAAHASQSNTWWTGAVFVENPENPTINYIVGVHGSGEKFALPVYMFTINGITGERINISYLCNRASATRRDGYDRHDTRMELVKAGWFDMDIYEQIAFAGISDEALEAYTQTATSFAQAQFNISGLSDIQLFSLSVNGITGNGADLAALTFTAIDNTGREAFVRIPSTDGVSRWVSISTDHNDFIPGFDS